MKNILIPTNFRLESLNSVKELCRQTEGENLQLVFVHLFKISDSISDLLMLNRRNREYEYISDAFYAQCEQIKATFPQIKHIKIDFFYGSRLAMFRNYLEAHQINYVLDPVHCNVQPLNRLSVDPQILIERSGLKVLTIKPKEMRAVNPGQIHEEVLVDAV